MTDHRPIRAADEATLLAPAQPGYGPFVLAIAAWPAFVDLGFRHVFFAAGNQRGQRYWLGAAFDSICPPEGRAASAPAEVIVGSAMRSGASDPTGAVRRRAT
jgi:hypothetical protein